MARNFTKSNTQGKNTIITVHLDSSLIKSNTLLCIVWPVDDFAAYVTPLKPSVQNLNISYHLRH